MCCLEGKIKLLLFPEPPEKIKQLWLGEVEESKVFLKHTRVINNDICLSSVIVHEKKLGGYNPSVIFQGCVNQLMSLLKTDDGDAHFAQLYLLDPVLETTKRIGNMNMPSNTSLEEQRILLSLLQTV